MRIKQNWMYFKYLIRHKYYVMKACHMLGLGTWVGLKHDMSKFLPSEWIPYKECFYDETGKKRYLETEEFINAWFLHQKRNKHHWQYWLLTLDKGNVQAVKMPERYMVEMVADWIGAGIAITGEMEVWEWYKANRNNMTLHPETRNDVEMLLRWTKIIHNKEEIKDRIYERNLPRN